MSEALEVRIGDEVRQTHPYGYRCGDWATIVGRAVFEPASLSPRVCWIVKFPDGARDQWPVSDPMAGYEFRGRRDSRGSGPRRSDPGQSRRGDGRAVVSTRHGRMAGARPDQREAIG